MFIHHDLFPPDSKFIQIFITGTCKYMQIYASLCNNYATLFIIISFIPCPEQPPLVQGALRD